MANRIKGLDEKITVSALQEFMVYGFKDASTNRIAKRSGVTSGALYIRYNNKDDIFEFLVAPASKGLDKIIDTYKGKFSELAKDSEWRKIFVLEAELMDIIIDFIFKNYSILSVSL